MKRGSRLQQFVLAIHILEEREERPTSRAVLREIGSYHNIAYVYGREMDNGMNGRDLRTFERAMESCGYRRVSVGFARRWVKSMRVSRAGTKEALR